MVKYRARSPPTISYKGHSVPGAVLTTIGRTTGRSCSAWPLQRHCLWDQKLKIGPSCAVLMCTTSSSPFTSSFSRQVATTPAPCTIVIGVGQSYRFCPPFFVDVRKTRQCRSDYAIWVTAKGKREHPNLLPRRCLSFDAWLSFIQLPRVSKPCSTLTRHSKRRALWCCFLPQRTRL